MGECGVDRGGAEQIVAYVRDTVAVLGTVPTSDTVVAERFFDESGGMQLVLHAPFGGAVNRAWGLALRKRFCLSFDFELQAAATDDGIVLSLGEQHSFPLASVFAMVRPATVERDLVQATLASPMFGTRWRWNATRALALLRHSRGRRVPMPIQRMRAEDLLAAVFPAQVACGDNHVGPIEPPAHPLVDETVANCLHEAMDLDGLRAVLARIERGEIRTVAVETPAPSLMAHEILNANPYAFLDNAPLEERRARAVALRRIDPDLAGGIGALDPAAIDEVRRQAWPDVRDADELHDALLSLVLLPLGDLGSWADLAAELRAAGRATDAHWTTDGRRSVALVAAERVAVVTAAIPTARLEPMLAPPPGTAPDARGQVAAPPGAHAPDGPDSEAALTMIVRGWLECSGPTTAGRLAARLGLPDAAVSAALTRLELEGSVLRGRFTAGEVAANGVHGAKHDGEEWCERRLLARIHRQTLGRLRREIDPVPAADFLRYLFRWQHVFPGTQLHGRDGLAAVIAELHGVELPAPAWERSVLPARVEGYEPALLDELCLAGVVVWGRFSPQTDPAAGHDGPRRRAQPTRVAPLALALRDELAALLDARPDIEATRLSPAARTIADFLASEGASFLGDIARATALLPSAAEDGLWELVARGLVTGDGFAGLRALLAPDEKPRPERRLRALRRARASRRMLPVGRWALLRGRTARHGAAAAPSPAAGIETAETPEALAERAARQLLRRYGVVLRELLARETLVPSWRTLLTVLRRLEARGEVRGGRFVAGFVGEQFALPEAVEALRAVRRQDDSGAIVLLGAADPLNLVGILTPGARLSPLSGHVIAFENGAPIATGELGAVRSRLHARVFATPVG